MGQQSAGAAIHPGKGQMFPHSSPAIAVKQSSQKWTLIFVAMHRVRLAAVPAKGRAGVGHSGHFEGETEIPW